MAHAVAPIPLLAEACHDCPQDLEEVYETMLAKDPRERYATPAEVAEAIAEFADEDAGRGCHRHGQRGLRGMQPASSIFAALRPLGKKTAPDRGDQRPPPHGEPANFAAAVSAECAMGCHRIAAGRDLGLLVAWNAAEVARWTRGRRAGAGSRKRGEWNRERGKAVASGDKGQGSRESRGDCRRPGAAAWTKRSLVVRRNALADALCAAGDCREAARTIRPWCSASTRTGISIPIRPRRRSGCGKLPDDVAEICPPEQFD